MAMDVTICGAGVFGLSIAFECARRGARVRVIDPAGVAAGASGGVVGALSPHAPDDWDEKKQFQFDGLLMAESFWAAVSAASGLATGYGRTGRLQPVPARGLDLAQRRGRAAEHNWRGLASWRLIQAGQWGPESATGLHVFDDLSARIRPKAACLALAEAIRSLGGTVVAGPQALPERDGFTRTQDASDSAFERKRQAAISDSLQSHPALGAVIWATGTSGLEHLSQDLAHPIGRGEKGQAALLRFAAPGLPQILSDGVLIVPHDDGTLAVGSTSERWYADLAVDHRLDELLARAAAIVPALAGAEVLCRWAGLRPRSVSRQPVLGPWPQRPGTFVANGGFKIGFGIAPKVAQVLAELVLEGRDLVPAGMRIEDCLRVKGV